MHFLLLSLTLLAISSTAFGSFSCRCLFNANATTTQMLSALNYVCGNLNCSAISPGGEFFDPNTVPEHSGWAIQAWWDAQGASPEACDFSGSASVICEDCTCALLNSSSIQQMKDTITWICSRMDCSAISPTGSHFLPDTLENHCNFAVNSWWLQHNWSINACTFSGIATLLPPVCGQQA